MTKQFDKKPEKTARNREKTMGERIRDRTLAQILCVNDLIKPLHEDHWKAMRGVIMAAVDDMYKQLKVEWDAS